MANDALPRGWRLAKLGELGEVNRGRSRHRPRYAEHLYCGAYPFIQTGDIKNSGGRITTYTQTYSDAGLAQSRLWPSGTMCITIAANIAETAVLTFPACFPDSVVGFIADKGRCNVFFIEYLFRQIKHRLQQEASGTVQDNINLATLDRLQLPMPPVAEQHAIAQVLGTLDDKIELNRRMNETLESMARALFKSWFVDFDPVRAKAEGSESTLPQYFTALFPDSFDLIENHEVPKGWKVVGLDKIGRFLNGLALQKFPPQGDRFLPVIKIAQLRTEDTVDADKASADLPAEYIVEDGDVLFSWSGSLECILWAGGKGALNQHLFNVTSDIYPKWFYYLWIHAHLPEFRLIASGKATTMGHIQRGHLSAAKVLVPPPDLLNEMDRFFAPLIRQVVNLKLASRTLGTIRDTLLPKLVSGELRIRDAEQFLRGQRL